MAVRCPRAEALAAAIVIWPDSVNAPHEYEARQRQLVGQVLCTDPSEEERGLDFLRFGRLIRTGIKHPGAVRDRSEHNKDRRPAF